MRQKTHVTSYIRLQICDNTSLIDAVYYKEDTQKSITKMGLGCPLRALPILVKTTRCTISPNERTSEWVSFEI